MGTAAFVVGIVLQCLVLTRGRFERGDLKRVGWALGGSALGYVFMFKGEHSFDAHAHFLAACVGFTAVFALQMRERILPYVNSTLVLAVSLVNAYGLLESAASRNGLVTAWFLVSLAPSVAVAVDALGGVRPGRAWQVGLYCWYLVLVVVLGISSMTWAGFHALVDRAGRGGDPGDAFLSGAVLAYLAVHAVYFVAFIRLPGRSESLAERRADWDKDVRSFDRHYLEASGTPRRAWVTLAVVVAALGTNLAMRWVPAHEVVRGAIGLLPLMAPWLVPAADVPAEARSARPGIADLRPVNDPIEAILDPRHVVNPERGPVRPIPPGPRPKWCGRR